MLNRNRKREAMTTGRSRTIIMLVVVGVLLSQLAVFLVINRSADNEANAAQRFTPETVESVPESFLRGGDRNLTALNEINATLRENGRKLDRIAQKLDELNANLTRLARERNEGE